MRCISLPDIQSASDIQSAFVDRRGSLWFTGDNVMHLAHPELLEWNGEQIPRASLEEYTDEAILNRLQSMHAPGAQIDTAATTVDRPCVYEINLPRSLTPAYHPHALLI